MITLTDVSKAVTFQDTGDTVTLASHGFSNGNTVRFLSITSTTGISANTWYYVINQTTNTFQLSLTYNFTTNTGTAIALTTDGTGSLEVYTTPVIGSTLVDYSSTVPNNVNPFDQGLTPITGPYIQSIAMPESPQGNMFSGMVNNLMVNTFKIDIVNILPWDMKFTPIGYGITTSTTPSTSLIEQWS